MGRLINKEDLQEVLAEIKKEGKTLAVTNGCFDILHVGHVRYLNMSAKQADYLMVLLNSDKSVRAIKGESRPINKEEDRAEVLSALNCVDYVMFFDENSPSKLLEEIKPDVYTKGADYNLENLPEAKSIQSYGGKIAFIDLVEGVSTTKILEKLNS
ncbi:D-glycero-beta-D-manno-heptose 1-phosphate adenylyltransferase [bacterium]|nr:D-glycero-beta-D-manno-heptose 1-phosphate adenylyltransferase [bacterium]